MGFYGYMEFYCYMRFYCYIEFEGVWQVENLKKTFLAEIPGFKEKGEAFLNGQLNKMGFKRASGGFGVYAHRNAKDFMIRLRIFSGILSKEQLKCVADLAEKYAVPTIHLTTRQAIQYHGVSLDDICHIMEEGITHNIYTRGAGGNFPRNVAISPLSGIDKNEAFDVTAYAMAVNHYFLERMATYHLPRKLKVAFSNSAADTAHATVQDLGFVATMKDMKPYFEVYIGGGLGQNPRLGTKLDELIPASEALFAVDAMVALFKAEGDYENHSRARIRYIAERMGAEGFKSCFMSYFNASKKKGGLEIKELQPHYEKTGKEKSFSHIAILPQKQSGLYSYYYHPMGGQLDLGLLKKINELIAPMKEVSGRLSMGEGIYLIHLTSDEVEKVAALLDDSNYLVGISQSRSCIGVPICQIGILESQKALSELVAYFKANNAPLESLPPLYISGCGNSCSAHQIGGIGLTGKRKKIGDCIKGVFDVYMDGNCQVGSSRLGKYMGEICDEYVGECFATLAEKVAKSQLGFYKYVAQNEEEVKAHLASYCK